MTLFDFFREVPSAALAFSGGTDSAYLLWAALRYKASVGVYYVNSAFQPAFELEDARRLTQALGVTLRVLPADILSCPEVAANPADRCYHCKRQIFSQIARAAQADGYRVVIDGTNASDDAAERPGMRALQELQVRSPLRECGLSKEEIRLRSREAGLLTWNKPAYSCLATRIPTGVPITAALLERTERAEARLAELGFSDLRVRSFHDCARIQLPAGQLPRAVALREELLSALRPEYANILLDLEARHG